MRTGAAILHDLKNRAREVSQGESACRDDDCRRWLREVGEFFRFARERCERAEREGIVEEGETGELESLLAPYRSAIVACLDRPGEISRENLERIWVFLQEQESCSGPLYRSVADELVEGGYGADDRDPHGPIVRAVKRVLSVLLPAPELSEGRVVFLAAERGIEELGWERGSEVTRTGLKIPSFLLDGVLRRLIARCLIP